MPDSRKKVWLGVRTGCMKLKKNWIKLHTLIDIQTRVVLLMNITPGVTGDCPTMVEMIKKLPKFLKQANGCFDSAYLSKRSVAC